MASVIGSDPFGSFGSSLDLSDSSLILEIGHSSEILRISRPFTHLGPLPLPLPLTLRLPLTGRRRDFLLLGRLLTRAPLSSMIVLFRFLVMTRIYHQVDTNMYKHGPCAGLCALFCKYIKYSRYFVVALDLISTWLFACLSSLQQLAETLGCNSFTTAISDPSRYVRGTSTSPLRI